MNLDELLTQTRTYLDDATVLIEGDADQLWSDDLLVRYLNEAQRLLARRAWCIIDVGNPDAGIIVLRTGVALYPLHKSILYIYDATPEDQEWPLSRHDDVALRMPRPFTDDFFNIDGANTASLPGAPLGFATDTGTRLMRIFRTPSIVENGLRVILRIARLPIQPLSLDFTENEPEVPEDYHFLLTTYAAGKCLTMPNVDGQSKTDGRLLLAEFDAAVKEARQDRQRAGRSASRWAFASATSVIR